jgi:hypothetical protein
MIEIKLMVFKEKENLLYILYIEKIYFFFFFK